MNLTSLSDVRALLSELSIRPSKPLGQNFLIDRNILEILIHAADLQEDDRVLEIGPGLGVVTEALLAGCSGVVAIEKDRGLYGHLVARFHEEPRLTLFHGDALDMWAKGFRKVPSFNKVVSNLPYSVGTRILMNFVIAESPPERLVVTVQKEVAQRLAAATGDVDYGMLSIWAQLLFEVRIVKTISPSCFWPRPEVKSCVVSLSRHDQCRPSFAGRQRLYELTRIAFKQRRKQLAPVFGQAAGIGGSREAWREVLKDLGLDEKIRPEMVSVDNWCRLLDVEVPMPRTSDDHIEHK